MKSAYELAMERLEAASGPTRKLSDAEKEALAEIDRKCEARIAGLRIDYDVRISAASSHEEFNGLKEELAREIMRAEESRDQQKDAIWGGG